MGSLVKFLQETYGKKSLLDAIKAGGWKALIDGNVGQTTLVHGPGATLVGTDEFGNKYYERMTEQFGRHRWVVYGNLNWEAHGQEPTTVPAEWHGWLHSIYDTPPSKVPPKKPIYALTQKPNMTGQPGCFLPKGAWQNPEKRNWQKMQMWQPPSRA
ncbi:hypothetical protein WJX72_011448 [[Myrmecia] bisecta]|uniref:NADH dehydrogenase [ubiquinone] 1 alpha subcomplex subunit 12 n=1 Tax=[Myrmecia] bisecta TaxID=41462 RepID=A0AAW1R9Z8_9CHLO